jgi:hypothetical protein
MFLLRAIFIGLGLLFLAIPGVAQADENSFTYKYIDGPNMIVVTHNVHHPQAGAPVTYNLRLYEREKGLPASFERVRVTISQDAKAVFGKSLTVSPYNDTDFSYAYPDPAEYTLSVQFLGQDRTIASGEFPIVVEPGLQKSGWLSLFTIQTGAAFLLGIGTATLFMKRTRVRSTFKTAIGRK